MRNRVTLPNKSSQLGVVLVEAMVAVLIFSVGVLAVAGLQATMIKNTTDSKLRADASYIAQKKLGEIWADPANRSSYAESGAVITDLLPQGKRVTTVQDFPAPANYSVVTVTVTWQQPGQDQHQFTTTSVISGS